ncbi:type I glyceraldehyde-3-phosphate dehydrogenase [archaeon]|nr:type I glyceraldehyde-3-phosphate dehydrogenase [archaeon]
MASKKKVRVAINGVGRIGRAILRAGYNDPKIEFVAINTLSDVEINSHLLQFDSVYGRFPAQVKAEKEYLVINGHKIRFLNEANPAKLPWKKLKIDVVMECTGAFCDRRGSQKHLQAGAKKVLLSAPCKGEPFDFRVVKGVNDQDYNQKEHHLIANQSCTTNCLAPIVKVLNDAFEITKGFMTTVHAYTADQNLHDGPHKDLRRARAAAINMLPTTTGASKAVAEIIPELKGLLHGIAIRVPVAVGSIVAFTAEVKAQTTKDGINQLFKQTANKKLKGILEYTELPLVSTDIIGNRHSTIFDASCTDVINANNDCLIKVLAWYDNEFGYACRMVEMAKQIMNS